MENNKKPEKKRNVFIKHLQFVLLLYIAGTLLIYCVYIIYPKYYKTSASIIKSSRQFLVQTPFERQDIANIADKKNTDLFISIMSSRKMKQDIVRKFNLINIYKARSEDDAIKILEKRTFFDSAKDNFIEVSFMDVNPQRSAEITNYYVENLSLIIKDMADTNVFSVQPQWIESRLAKIKANITFLDKRISELQNRYGIIVDNDLSELTRLAGRLSEKVIFKKIELNKMESGLLEKNNQLRSTIKREIEQMEKKLLELTALRDELVVINRELHIQEMLYGSLSQKLEDLRTTESAKIPVVHIFEKAGTPERINKPDLKFLLALNTVICGIIVVVILFFDLLKYLGSI